MSILRMPRATRRISFSPSGESGRSASSGYFRGSALPASAWRTMTASMWTSVRDRSGVNLVQRHYPAVHVVADMAMVQPRAGVVRDHVGRHHLRGRERDHVGALLGPQHGVAVPVRRMEVEAEADRHQVPADALCV